MKLKTRIFLSFIILIVVPISLILIIMLSLSYHYKQDIDSFYNIRSNGLEIVFDPLRYYSELTKTTYQELQQIANTNPEKLEDIDYLNAINEELLERNSFLLVADRKESISGSDRESMNDDVTPSEDKGSKYFTLNDEFLDKFMNSDGKTSTFTRTIFYQYANGDDARIYIVTHLNNQMIELRKLFVFLSNVVILILIVSVAIITINMYRSVALPILQIKKATQNIKEGNLDFEIHVKAVQEIEELANDFEEMRGRLKIQAEDKIKYDCESKELISNISHDLKTPITAVKGYVEGIIDGVADTPEKMNKYIKTIYNKANEMDRLINELTFYSKIDTNRIPYTFTKLNVANYFSDCIDEVGFDLESKNMEIAYYNNTPIETQIIADAEQLKRVINNIVGNSIKYLDKPKGYIDIRIKDDGDFIQVEIEDNGKGIGESELPYIFDRFYRTDTSRNSAKGGSGIGLSIVKKIIEDHGGEIWATSRELAGTVMFFKLRKYQEVQIYE
ncbi:MAG: ATP-binding protein [Lachnotalea sp.]